MTARSSSFNRNLPLVGGVQQDVSPQVAHFVYKRMRPICEAPVSELAHAMPMAFLKRSCNRLIRNPIGFWPKRHLQFENNGSKPTPSHMLKSKPIALGALACHAPSWHWRSRVRILSGARYWKMDRRRVGMVLVVPLNPLCYIEIMTVDIRWYKSQRRFDKRFPKKRYQHATLLVRAVQFKPPGIVLLARPISSCRKPSVSMAEQMSGRYGQGFPQVFPHLTYRRPKQNLTMPGLEPRQSEESIRRPAKYAI